MIVSQVLLDHSHPGPTVLAQLALLELKLSLDGSITDWRLEGPWEPSLPVLVSQVAPPRQVEAVWFEVRNHGLPGWRLVLVGRDGSLVQLPVRDGFGPWGHFSDSLLLV